jgi:hypothetical protein
MGAKANQLTKSVRTLFTAHGFVVWRNQSGAAKRGDYFIRLGETGLPDLMMTRTGIGLICCEIKASHGEQLSPGQLDFKQRLEAAGARYYIIRATDDALAALQELEENAGEKPSTTSA